MDAVLLAGGYGTRLRPLTYTRPKPLIEVAGRPMMDHVLDRLPADVDHLVVCVNWLADALRRHLADAPRRLRITVVEEKEPLGTAGALRNASAHLQASRLFVLNADILSTMDLAALARQHRATGAVATLAVTQVPPAEVVDYGVIRPAAGPGCAEAPQAIRIAAFVEKPRTAAEAPSRWINAGATLLERSIVDEVPQGRLVSLEKEVFPTLIPRGLWGFPFSGLWIDVGDARRLREAHARLGGAAHAGGVSPAAHIVASVLGRGCTVGADARVVDCVLGDGVQVAPGARLEDCIIGDHERVSGEHRGSRIWSHQVPAGYPDGQVGNARPA